MGTSCTICKENLKPEEASRSQLDMAPSPQRVLSWSDVPRLIKAVSVIQKHYRLHRTRLIASADKVCTHVLSLDLGNRRERIAFPGQEWQPAAEFEADAHVPRRQQICW